MARDSHLFILRNQNIKKRFHEVSMKNPNWKYKAVLNEVSSQFYLSTRTISAIINEEKAYNKESDRLRLQQFKLDI